MPIRRSALWQLSLRVAPEDEEPVAALLERISGEGPVVYVDFATGQRFVSVYLLEPPSRTKRRQLEESLQQIGDGRSEILGTVRVRQKDWAHAWKIHFRPIHIARRLVLRPSWRQVPKKPGRIIITLDPGLAFGTGHHPTTAFCLEQLVSFQRKRSRGKSRSYEALSMLDVGTGSGILAIAAAKLGYRPVEAFDWEEDSIEIARANARRNRVLPRIKFYQQDVMALPVRPKRCFDAVCANLISDLLCQQRERLVSRVAEDGLLVLAGILGRNFPEVEAAYRALGFALVDSHQGGEWKSGSFARVGSASSAHLE